MRSILSDKNFRRDALIIAAIEIVIFLFFCVIFAVSTASPEEVFKAREIPDFGEYHPNFNACEYLAGFFMLIIISASLVLYRNYSPSRQLLLTTGWIAIATIMICLADAIVGGTIYNHHPGGGGWCARTVFLSPFAVAMCGLAYAIPLVLGVVICRTNFRSDRRPKVSEDGKAVCVKKILRIVWCIVVMIMAIISSWIFNMMIYILFI